jgi:hypothetical protein
MLDIEKVIKKIEDSHGIEKNGRVFHHSTNLGIEKKIDFFFFYTYF